MAPICARKLKIHFNIILCLYLGLPSGHFLLGLRTRNLYVSLFSPACEVLYQTRPAWSGSPQSANMALHHSVVHIVTVSGRVLCSASPRHQPSLWYSLEGTDAVLAEVLHLVIPGLDRGLPVLLSVWTNALR